MRYWTLIGCLGCFLDEQRAQQEAAESGTHVTWGDVGRALQRQHCRNLLTWLEQEFRAGTTAEALYERLAA